MNLVYIQGKIVSEIEFKFIINSKNISIVMFEIELLNKSVVTVRAYNHLADYCYSKLEKEKWIMLEGNINTNMEIIVNNIEEL